MCKGMKKCSKCEAAARAHQISGTMKKSSSISAARLGGMAVGYAGSRFLSKKVTFLQGTIGGVVKTAAGIGLSMYSKPGSMMQGLGDGVFLQGVDTLGTSTGIFGLQPGRLGLSDTARMRRLNNAIGGDGSLSGGSDAAVGRRRVYAKVA